MYVYEFLYRGRVKEEDAAYHVLLGDVMEFAGEQKHVETPPLTAAQAEALGFPLPVILAEINATMLRERDEARVERVALTIERDALILERDRLAREQDALRTELDRINRIVTGNR